MPNNNEKNCCNRGGKRSGCGRKPGVRTQPIRLPEWLLEQLNEQGDAKQLIIQACIAQYPSMQCTTDLSSSDYTSMDSSSINSPTIDSTRTKNSVTSQTCADNND